jgi:hypothetical protein
MERERGEMIDRDLNRVSVGTFSYLSTPLGESGKYVCMYVCMYLGERIGDKKEGVNYQ